MRRLAPCLFALVACGAPSGHAQPTAEPPRPTETEARAESRPAAPRCVAEPYRTHGTAVGCQALGFVAVLPGRGWSLRESVPGAPRVLLAAELSPYLQMAVMARPPGDEPVDADAVLMDLYARAAESARARGHELTAPELGESRPNRPTLTYEARDLVVDGQAYRSLHVWTTAQRPDGLRLAYHLSWTGPAERVDPELALTMQATTAAFVLVDDDGRAIAD